MLRFNAFAGLLVLAACSSDPPASSSGPGVFGGGTSGSTPTTPTVECTHPGAGKSVGNDLCECATTLKIDGDWSSNRTCRESNTCPVNAADESMKFTQAGTEVTAQSATYKLTGTLCGDTIKWTGGPASGAYKECGLLRFTDDTHYVKDSCFVASGSCTPNFGQGCPSEKGQCTATGAKKPAAAPPIIKDLCL